MTRGDSSPPRRRGDSSRSRARDIAQSAAARGDVDDVLSVVAAAAASDGGLIERLDATFLPPLALFSRLVLALLLSRPDDPLLSFSGRFDSKRAPLVLLLCTRRCGDDDSVCFADGGELESMALTKATARCDVVVDDDDDKAFCERDNSCFDDNCRPLPSELSSLPRDVERRWFRTRLRNDCCWAPLSARYIANTRSSSRGDTVVVVAVVAVIAAVDVIAEESFSRTESKRNKNRPEIETTEQTERSAQIGRRQKHKTNHPTVAV